MDRRHHDLFFKYVFGKAQHARGAFRAWLPPRTKSALDFVTLENKTRELIGADLSLRHCDLASEDDEGLQSADATPLARLAWLMLKHAAKGDDLAACLRGWPELVRPLEESAEDTEAVASYALRAGNVSREDLAQTMQALAGPRSREVVMTTAEKLHKEGQQHVLLRQLRRRFESAVTAEVEARVRAAGQAELDVWADRVLAASTLDEVFATQ